jgi:hypothetical protein
MATLGPSARPHVGRPRTARCPHALALFLARRQAQAGLFRDGGVTADEVARYVREIRREAEEIVRRQAARAGGAKVAAGAR